MRAWVKCRLTWERLPRSRNEPSQATFIGVANSYTQIDQVQLISGNTGINYNFGLYFQTNS